MKSQYEKVKEFHKACGVEMPNVPTLLGNDGHVYTLSGYAEELHKICENMKGASSEGFGGELLARASYMLEELVELLVANSIEDQADALTDLQYFVTGTFTLLGVNPDPIFDIVHNANMQKVGPDGKVKRNEQGKILKPEGWVAPEPLIVDELYRQGLRGPLGD